MFVAVHDLVPLAAYPSAEADTPHFASIYLSDMCASASAGYACVIFMNANEIDIILFCYSVPGFLFSTADR